MPAWRTVSGRAADGPEPADTDRDRQEVVCFAEVAVVPVLGDWVGDRANQCSNGNVIDHPGR
ncbi:hypothetical protein ACWDRR_22805 [Kitasatospora sp. NPDC003701]